MRLFFLSLLLVNILCFGVSLAQEAEPRSVPSAFDAILQRVKERDRRHRAIYLCMRFSDAPSAGAIYSIAIKPIHGTSDVIVELRGVSDPKIVYESYDYVALLRSTVRWINQCSESTT